MGRKLIKELIEKRIGKPLRQIIIENLHLGVGRYDAANIIENLCEKHRQKGEPSFRVLHSTLWYTIKRMIESGELCEVEGDPESPPLFHFNYEKKGRHLDKKEEVEIEIEHHWTCGTCGHTWTEVTQVKNFSLMFLRSKSCPICTVNKKNTFGKIILDFKYQGIKARKGVSLVDGKIRETFIDERGVPCESPFELVTF